MFAVLYFISIYFGIDLMCDDQNGMNGISVTVILSKIYHERKEKSYIKVIVGYSLVFFRLCLPIDISQHVHVNYARIKYKIIN